MSRAPIFVPPLDQFAGATVAYVDAADALKANLASPGFTGTPTAPTPAPNDNSTKVATTAYVDNAMPVGSIIMYGGNTPPTGWHLCDGTVHGSSALQTVLGSTTTPDLRDKFIVCAGGAYTRGATGGANSVTLTASQSGVPAHNHTATTSAETTDHTHSGTTGSENATHTHSGTTTNTGSHTHGGGYRMNYMLQGSDGANNGIWFGTQTEDTLYDAYGAAGAHAHSVTTGGQSANHQHAFSTGGRSASHTHAVSVSNNAGADAASSHENRPPYYALVFIVKK